jgi:hypothetical protein
LACRISARWGAAIAGELESVVDLAILLSEAEIVLSICPPEFAEDVAR